MELNINRTDYSALDNINNVLKQLERSNHDFDDYDWALEMIRHEVEQTGRF